LLNIYEREVINKKKIKTSHKKKERKPITQLLATKLLKIKEKNESS
jgi:hypothetical protein